MCGLRAGAGRCVRHFGPDTEVQIKEDPGTVSCAQDIKRPGVSRGEAGSASLLPSRSSLTAGSEKPDSLVTAATRW